MPAVNWRYWAAITFASLFGTNLGDFYAHESGLGIVPGISILAVLAALVFVVERFDRRPRELYYWLVIIIIRTGATNIADYLAFEVRVPPAPLTLTLALLLAGFAAISARTTRRAGDAGRGKGMPDTGAAYWAAMLSAGVFGTVVGDICSHAVGEGYASLGLAVLLAVALTVWRRHGSDRLWAYWLAVAVARTTGTAMGDFLAENERLAIGLPLATIITGSIFLAILLAWPRRADPPVPLRDVASGRR